MNEKEELRDAHRQALIELAEWTIALSVTQGRKPEIDAAAVRDVPNLRRATFVTVYVDGALNGCIGALEPVRPLAEDVVHNAHAAAMRDPRFPPVVHEDLDRLDVEVCVLEPLERVEASCEAELLDKIVPGVHGILLETPYARGTLLPSVWQKCPDPEQFLAHLKRKARLAPNAWPPELMAYRYTVDAFDRASLSG